MNNFQHIIELIRKGDVILFVGAGFSIAAGAPSGKELCDTIYQALPDNIQKGEHIQTEYTLQNLSETYELHNGRDALIDLLQKSFTFTPKDISDQKQLVSIPQFKHIITTNYDSLIEDAYENNCNVVTRNSNLSKIDPNKPTIYKIHGDFSCPNNIVITKTDYNRLYEKQQEKLIWDSIRVEISRHNILFIGYSISDQNIQMLLDDVKKHMGNSAKQLFVLTPNIDETARLRLHKLGATHIQGKAKDLFKELIPAIKDHIVEDFEKRATTSEDCAQFLKEYDLCPQVELGGVHTPNKLLSVRSISGKAVLHTINFSLKGNGTENPLEQIHPYYDKNFGYLPTRRITDFNNFEYRANSILMNRGDNISAIYLVTIPKKGEISISIPQKRILQKACCRYYENCDNQLQIDADIDIGDFQILIPIAPNDTVGFRLKNREKYQNNATAIAWANVFYAIFSGCEFTLSIISEDNISKQFTYSFKKSKIRNEQKQAKQILQYYKYIHEIELLQGVNFKEYENFSEKNFIIAEKIYYYLKKEPMVIRHPSHGFEYEIKTTDSTIQPHGEYALIDSFQDTICVLNGKTFTIPYIKSIYKQSLLKSKRTDENGNYILRFVDHAKEHTIHLTDMPIEIKTKEGVVNL